MDIYPFKSLIITTIIEWHLSTKVVELIQFFLCLFEFNPRVIHGIHGFIHEFYKGVKFVEGNTMRLSVLFLRMSRRLETFVVLDNPVEVGLGLVGGSGHADGERHFSTLALSRIHLGLGNIFSDLS